MTYCTIFIIYVLVITAAAELTCHKGEYVSKSSEGSDVCLPCPEGTFVSYDNHQNESCAICTRAEEASHETTILECEATYDTIIGCVQGFYRIERGNAYIRDGYCERCTQCGTNNTYVGEACGSLRDTICCPQPNMRVIRGNEDRIWCLSPHRSG